MQREREIRCISFFMSLKAPIARLKTVYSFIDLHLRIPSSVQVPFFIALSLFFSWPILQLKLPWPQVTKVHEKVSFFGQKNYLLTGHLNE